MNNLKLKTNTLANLRTQQLRIRSMHCLLGSLLLIHSNASNATGLIKEIPNKFNQAPVVLENTDLSSDDIVFENDVINDLTAKLIIKPDTAPPTATLSLRKNSQTALWELPWYVNVYVFINKQPIDLEEPELSLPTPVIRDFSTQFGTTEIDQEIRLPVFFFDPVNQPVETAQLVITLTPEPLIDESSPLLVAQTDGMVIKHSVDSTNENNFPFPLVSAECPDFVNFAGSSRVTFECELANFSNHPVTVDYTLQQLSPGVFINGDSIAEGTLVWPLSEAQPAPQSLRLEADKVDNLPAVWRYHFAPTLPRYTVSSTGLIIGVGDSFGGIHFLDSEQPTFKLLDPAVKLPPAPSVIDNPLQSPGNLALNQRPLYQINGGTAPRTQLAGVSNKTINEVTVFNLLSEEEMGRLFFEAHSLKLLIESALKRCDSVEATRLKNQLVKSQKYSLQKMKEHVDLIARLSNKLNDKGKELLKFIPNDSIQDKAANSVLDKVKSTLTEGADKALKGASGVPVVGQAIMATKFIDDLAKDYEKNQQIQAILKEMKNILKQIDDVAKNYGKWHEVQLAQVDALDYVADVAIKQACQPH